MKLPIYVVEAYEGDFFYDDNGNRVEAAEIVAAINGAGSPEGGALAALELAKAWIEESEDQTMEEAIRIEGRFQERGSIGYNQQYIAMCKAVLQALSQPQK